MSVLVVTKTEVHVVAKKDDPKNYLITPLYHTRYRAVVIHCDPIHTQWYRESIEQYSLIEGRLERYLQYLRHTGLSIITVERNEGTYDVIYYSKDVDEAPYIADNECVIYDLGQITDSVVAQRYLSHQHQQGDELNLQPLLDTGLLEGTLTKHYLT